MSAALVILGMAALVVVIAVLVGVASAAVYRRRVQWLEESFDIPKPRPRRKRPKRAHNRSRKRARK